MAIRPFIRSGDLALALVLTLAVSASAQPPPAVTVTVAQKASGSRPKIGVALGGGSARGFAHIGVLQWLEEHRIPVDYIAGTSMGGLVAGAYATGLSPAEILEMMKVVDWDLMFLADSPFKYKTYRRKQDRRAYPSLVEFGLKGGFRLPSGLNPGQQVALLLDHIALSYYDIKTFEELPTPYRCVATDLRKAEAVVLGRGSLSQAMRATMAIPGVFTPVNIDDWLLVDGGALNNVPADVVREMGADIVISVNVAADPATAEEDREAQQSLFALLGRTIDTMMTGSVRQALEKSDVVVDPDLRGLNSMDWRKSDELSLRGLQGAEAQAARLTAYQLSAEDHAAFMAARAARRRTTVPIPQSIVIRGASPRDEEYIRGVLATHVGKPFDEEALVRDVLGITGRDLYEYLTYRFSEQEGKPALVVNVRPKSYGPPFLNLLFELSNVDSSSFAANLGGRVTAYDVLGAGSELRGDFILGTEQGIAAELYNPIGRAGLFVAPRAYFERTGRNYYIDEVFVAEYRVKRAGVGADVGWTSGRRAEIRFGADIADLRGRRRVGDPRLPEASGTEKSVRLQFVFDGQTSPMVPTRGLYLRSGLRRYLAVPQAIVNGEPIESQKRFWQGETEASAFHRLPNDDRLFALAGGGTSFGAEPLFNDFALGGPLRLGAFNNDELRGDNFLLLTAGYLHKIGRLPDVLGGNFYLGGWLENGTAFDDWDDQNWRSNVSVGAVLESLLGPVYFGASVGFDGRHRFYVALGPFLRY